MSIHLCDRATSGGADENVALGVALGPLDQYPDKRRKDKKRQDKTRSFSWPWGSEGFLSSGPVDVHNT